jgi:hypothetical protein
MQRANGAGLAVGFYQLVAVAGQMPDAGTKHVEIARRMAMRWVIARHGPRWTILTMPSLPSQ